MSNVIIRFFSFWLGMAMGRVWGRDPIPRPRPVIPTPSPILALSRSRGNFLPPVHAPQGTRPAPI
jgi:hypothetical protein